MRKPNTSRGPGQPPKERQTRYPIRLHESERAQWRVAAARAGLSLLDWIPEVLNREALRPTHVPPLGICVAVPAETRERSESYEIDASPRVDRSR